MKNFGEFGKLQQFITFFANFHNFHIIAYGFTIACSSSTLRRLLGLYLHLNLCIHNTQLAIQAPYNPLAYMVLNTPCSYNIAIATLLAVLPLYQQILLYNELSYVHKYLRSGQRCNKNKLVCANNQCMVTVHAAQALFLAKQMVPCAVGLGVSTVLSERHSMHNYMQSIDRLL